MLFLMSKNRRSEKLEQVEVHWYFSKIPFYILDSATELASDGLFFKRLTTYDNGYCATTPITKIDLCQNQNITICQFVSNLQTKHKL
jgi:hypothetical protein